MKLIELLINETDDGSGMEALGLVEKPAHEGDFAFFGSEDLEDTILFSLLEVAMEEECANENYYDNLDEATQEGILKRLEKIGVKKSEYIILPQDNFGVGSINSTAARPDSWTNRSGGGYKTLFEYVGPKDTKNRPFCSKLLNLDLLFRKEDIDRLTVSGANSDEFGVYNIFTYKGSFNCRHTWREVKVADKRNEDDPLIVAALLLDENRISNQGFSHLNFSVDESKRIVVGPLMIPNKKIIRIDDKTGEPYEVFFSKDTIEMISNKLMKSGDINSLNLEHNPNIPIQGYMMETWKVVDPEKDKQVLYGFNFEEGTWLGMYKIESEEIWQMVVEGKIKGFSIEGYFANKIINK